MKRILYAGIQRDIRDLFDFLDIESLFFFFSGKHPVSALVELCSKHKWKPPSFEVIYDTGPDHKKNYLMKVSCHPEFE